VIREPDQAYEIQRAWRDSRIQASVSDSPQSLWHYTDAHGLEGIVENQYFWATETRFLNDAAETTYGQDVFLTVLEELVRNRESRTRDLIAKAFFGAGRPASSFVDEHSRTFVTCFCDDGDLLSQWRAYAGRDSVGGYALEFCPPGALVNWAIAAPIDPPVQLRKISYDPLEQEREARRLIEPLLAVMGPHVYDKSISNSCVAALVDGMVDFSSAAKHPSFAEEREWRFIYTVPKDLGMAKPTLPVKHRVSGGVFLPYVQLTVLAGVGTSYNRLPLRTINCGPSLHPARKKRGLESYLSERTGYKGVNVTGSDSPAYL